MDVRRVYNGHMVMLSKQSDIEYWDSRTRNSSVYPGWISNFRRSVCFKCGISWEDRPLHLHHLIPLRDILIAIFAMYRYPEEAFEHVLQLHEQGMVLCVTLCELCHFKLHNEKGFTLIPEKDVETDTRPINPSDWTCTFRGNKYVYDLTGRSTEPKHLSLSTHQLLLGLNWHILNGRMTSGRIIRLDYRETARLLGKIDEQQTSISSFVRSLPKSIHRFHLNNIIVAHQGYKKDDRDKGPNVGTEFHLTKQHIANLQDNPWFIRMSDVRGRQCSMPFALRLYLSQFATKLKSIKLSTLAERLNYQSYKHGKRHLVRSLEKAIEQISWAKYIQKAGSDTLSFYMDRQPVPIHSLRKVLSEHLHSV